MPMTTEKFKDYAGFLRLQDLRDRCRKAEQQKPFAQQRAGAEATRNRDPPKTNGTRAHRSREPARLEREIFPGLRATRGRRSLSGRVAWHARWRRRVTEGTLILDLRDAKKQVLVWRAIAVVDKSDPLKIKDHLPDMVRKSAEKYPPKK
jgi:hypothetical protein